MEKEQVFFAWFAARLIEDRRIRAECPTTVKRIVISATSTMTSVEPGVLDANVLAYAINADAAQHVAARTLLEAARDPSTSLYVNGVQRIYTFTPGDFQVFAELSVVTPT